MNEANLKDRDEPSPEYLEAQKLTQEELDQAIQRDVQLHEQFYILYVVDGYLTGYSVDDGDTYTYWWGRTPIEAMKMCFSQVRNQRGRT